MKKNYVYLFAITLMTIMSFSAIAQCIPTSVRPVFGTVTGSTGTQTFNNVPTGNVVRITAPAAGVFYTISMCQTNGGIPQADGVDDSQLTVLDFNSAAATSLAFNDDFCPTTGGSGYGPSEVTYTSTAAGDIFVYLTEWNTGGTASCIADGVNSSYVMTVTKSSTAPPCNSGVLTTTGFPLNHCAGDGFTIATDGTESTANDFTLVFSPQAGATGGLGNTFNLNGVTFPYSGDEDLNGTLSTNSFPVLSGNWAIYTAARDAAGDICSQSSDSVIINFLSATDPLCAPAGNNLALENSNITNANKQEIAGFIPNFVVDFTERTNVLISVDVRNTSTTAATSFDIETTVSSQDGTITDVVNTTVNATIPAGGVYTYTLPAKNLTTLFPAQPTDEVLFLNFDLLSSASNATIDANDSIINFIVAPINSMSIPYSTSYELRDAADAVDFNQDTWGWKYIDNDNDGNTFGPYSFTNVPAQTGDHCVIGSIIGGNNLSTGAIDETLQSPNLSLTAGTTYDFSIYGYTLAGETGAVDMVLTDEAGTFTSTLGTISLGVNDTVPAKFTFSGTVPATANDILVNINKSATNFVFLDLFEIVVGTTGPCSSGVLSTTGFPLNHCPGDGFTISTDGSESTNGDYALAFSPQAGATGAGNAGFTLSGVTFPYTGDEGLNGVLAANSVPNLSGNWTIYTIARDTIGGTPSICSQSTDSVIINFLATNDPLCSGAGTPCVTAANTYNNLATAGGAPCNDGTGCTPTDAGFTTFGIFGSEAYELPGVQAGFDYVFDMCSGTGAGAWIPAITIVAPSGAVDAFNLGTTGTFAQNCSLPWTASESGTYLIVIHEQGQPCGTETLVDNGNPTVTCGVNPATCLPCTAGGLVSSSNVVVCGTDQDSIILDGTQSTPGTYEVFFDNAAGGTGAGNNPFTIVGINSFPWVFDNDVDGVLSAQNPPLPPLSGMWTMTVFNADASGVYCDSISTIINVNFVDPTDPLCSPNPNCAITALAAGNQSVCNPITNTYAQEVIVTFNNAPTTGTLNVNGQSFPLGTSPQTVTLTNLPSDGLPVNVTALFSADAACTLTTNALFTASASCLCSFTAVNATTQSACNPANNTYSQDVVVTYSNAPSTGTLDVNGQSFAISTSPQTVTLTNLVSDGNNVDINASFSQAPNCALTQAAGFTAPISCSCSITDLNAGQSTPCVNTTNTFTQDVVVTYSNAPASGSLTINGQNFPITGSPQTVTLTGLISNGAAYDVIASFTADPTCTFSENNLFTAPAGCLCPAINVNVTTTPVTNCTNPNGSATAVATGGTGSYNYVWTPNSFGSGPSINNIPSGSYSVVATDGNGCFGTGSGNVSNSSGVNALVGNVSNVTCFGGNNGSIQVNASGGTAPISYTWSDQTFASTVSTRSNLTAGTYTIIVADAGNCSVTLGPIVITQPDQLVVTVDNSSDVTCNGDNDGEINVTVTGGNGNNTYSWSNGGGNSEDASNLNGGNYVLTVTDAGCPSVSSNSVTINEPAPISINLDGITDLDCFGDGDGSILVTTSGGTGSLNYVWDNAPNIEDVLNADGGTYQLTVTDDNMCTATSPTYTIDEPTELEVSVTATSDVSCFTGNDGSITTNITGGTGVYTLLWTNGGGTSASPTNLTANSYQLSVTDANMCNTVSSLVTINEPSQGVSATATSTPENNSSSDGTATVVATGGTAPYTFLWNDASGQTNSAATGLIAGTYSCDITDDNGCTTTVSVEVGKVNSITELAIAELNIYPNPTQGIVNVSFSTDAFIDFDINIMNTIGKKVYTNSFENVNDKFNEQITLNDLSSGIYFIEISNEDAKSVYKITLSK